MSQRRKLPLEEEAFDGKIGETAKESVQSFPQVVAPPKGAPNIVLVLLDDVGFGQPSTFGGPVEMPTLDRLAGNGLRYNRFHTTAMCTPTRAALLTGRNHHSVGNGSITNLATGFPGYNSIWPRNAACIAEVLRANGYGTSAFGKWHNTPEWETSPAGPFDRWPTGLGFDYFYGFLGADANQWDPVLVENTRPVSRPADDPPMHLDEDLANKAISWIRLQRSVTPDRPFFLYLAPGTAHSPLHAPKEWIDKYRGCFDHGWDEERRRTYARQLEMGIIPHNTKLTPRPAEIPAWEDGSEAEKRLGARQMEAFAGALSHCDYQIGRVIDELNVQGIADDTLVIFIAGDNGPSAEGTLIGQVNKWSNLNGMPETLEEQLARIDDIGGPKSYNSYPVGWAWAGSSPLQWVKQIASHLGGTRNGMVMSWPNGILDHGKLREQFHHCIDIVPTLLDVAGIPMPEEVNGVSQCDVEGLSMTYTFQESEVKSQRTTQYFELLGHRAIFHDGWIATARHQGRLPWQIGGGNATGDFDSDTWELYNIENDFSQANDLAQQFPEKLKELQALWRKEAVKHKVFPLDDRYGERYHQGPSPARNRTHFTYASGVFGIPEGSAPNVKGRSHKITADVVIQDATEGAIVAAGGRFGGYALYIQNQRLHYVYNVSGLERHRVSSDHALPAGEHCLIMIFESERTTPGSGGEVILQVDGQEVGRGKIPRTVPIQYSYTETFDIGRDNGTPVDEAYRSPFVFNSVIRSVVIEILTPLSDKECAVENQAQMRARYENE
ncbi:arylsulfatase [Advenella kashmirensis W13003]|uniref:Arylsulfatase n=1 Tax=Advenella kashmirensis W13003 TaxID=1424334 RepID=V8QRJ7_9BURK|nr:arylsulfatase [Advenella kashmirensis]ETF01599.1 arylsulfatase [Advenella kashmirensis W13003]